MSPVVRAVVFAAAAVLFGLIAVAAADADPRIGGLTGAPEEIRAATLAFGAVARKVALKTGGYAMERIAALNLVDSNGLIVDRAAAR